MFLIGQFLMLCGLALLSQPMLITNIVKSLCGHRQGQVLRLINFVEITSPNNQLLWLHYDQLGA
jgi:hypothetical protein